MKVAVLGLGSIGLRHARNALSQGVDVVGFDPSPDRQQMGLSLGCQSAASRDEALADADAAIVATPNECHLDDLRSCLESGCHAFVEKPLAHVVAGVEALLEEAERRGLHVQTGFNFRIHPSVKAGRNILQDNGIGTILWARFQGASYLPDWRPGSDYRKGYAANRLTGGALFDFIHEFDLALYLLGPAEVVASTARRTGMLDMPSEDCSDTILRHADGCHSTLHLDYVTRPPQRYVEIAGSEGLLRLDLHNRAFVHLNKNGDISADEKFQSSFDDDYREELMNFFSCCRGDAEPHCSGWEGHASLKLVIEARFMAGLPST